jgi:hypothetical protein
MASPYIIKGKAFLFLPRKKKNKKRKLPPFKAQGYSSPPPALE